MSLHDIQDDDRPTALRALRDYLVESLKVAETGHVAAISRQLQAVLAEFARIDVPTEESLSDDLARRRPDRLARAAFDPR